MKLLGSLIVLCGLAVAQSDRGSITGVVSDPGGAVVPSAAIEARNTATGGVYEAVTTATGNYTLSELPAGPYELSVTSPVSRSSCGTASSCKCAKLRIDAELEVGVATESVTISAAAPLLKTESGELSHRSRSNV